VTTTSDELPWGPTLYRDVISKLRSAGLSYEERGIWFELRAYQWIEGALPADLRSIAKMLGLRVAAIRRVVERFYPLTADGADRQDPELELARAVAETARTKRARAAKLRWGRDPDEAGTVAPAPSGRRRHRGTAMQERGSVRGSQHSSMPGSMPGSSKQKQSTASAPEEISESGAEDLASPVGARGRSMPRHTPAPDETIPLYQTLGLTEAEAELHRRELANALRALAAEPVPPPPAEASTPAAETPRVALVPSPRRQVG
jgi:uncharacterized protein YdaU (DUF1376 family)